MAKSKTQIVEAKQLDLFAPVEVHAERIDKAIVGIVKNVLVIGAELAKAHDKLAHHGNGVFTEWVEKRCGLGRTSAHKYMRAVAVFDPQVCSHYEQTFDDSAMFLLAAPSTPREALDAALERADSGEKITHKIAKQIVAEFKPQPKVVSHASPRSEDFPDPAQEETVTIGREVLRDLAEQVEGLIPPMLKSKSGVTVTDVPVETDEILDIAEQLDKLSEQRQGAPPISRERRAQCKALELQQLADELGDILQNGKADAATFNKMDAAASKYNKSLMRGVRTWIGHGLTELRSGNRPVKALQKIRLGVKKVTAGQ